MNKKIPFFSIITVVRNDLIGLQKTFESVAFQKNKDYEWIVVDGASTDGCVTFLESLKSENFQWISEPDNGIYQAMNKGIFRALGEFVVFLNAGDFFPEEITLQSVKNRLTSSDQIADVLFGGAMLFFPSGKSVYRAPREISSYIWHGLPSIHQATYYKNKVIKATNYNETYQITGDYYLIAKLYKLGITSIIYNKSLVEFRVGDTSFKRPFRLIIESNRVQKEILKLGIIRRFVSFCKKIFAFTVLLFLVKNLIPNYVIRKMSS